jgi:DNA-binding CsgD family transcriptional regulator
MVANSANRRSLNGRWLLLNYSIELLNRILLRSALSRVRRAQIESQRDALNQQMRQAVGRLTCAKAATRPSTHSAAPGRVSRTTCGPRDHLSAAVGHHHIAIGSGYTCAKSLVSTDERTMHKSSSRGRIVATDAPMVARATELERVLSALDDTVAMRRLQMVLLAGEPGVGKTRLARESLARAGARGALVFAGRCFEQHTAIPFFPFTEPFAAALAEAPAELQAELRDGWPELAYIVPELGSTPTTEGQETQPQVFRAAAAFLHALAGVKPLVLMLDDLHWADSTSLALLLYLGRHLHDTRMLIVGTYRDMEVGRQHPLEPILRELIHDRVVEEIHLGRLSLAGTDELVRSRVAVEDVSDELITLVHERAQGNPFFTEELLAAYVEDGAPPGAEVGLQPARLPRLRVPHSIRSVVGERVGRLPSEAQELLSAASILGQEFDLPVLVAAIDRPEPEVFTGLDAALESRLVEESRDGHGGRFAFVHALIQQTLYEELPAHRRRRLHLRVGGVLEKLRAEHAGATAELAWHFLQGGDTATAATYAIRAGDDAAGRYAHAEAAHHYAIAVEALRELGGAARAAEVQCRLAGELFDLNRLPDALAAYEAALAAFERRGDRAGQASAHWGLGRLHLGRYDIRAAETHLDAALRLRPAEPEDADLARLLVDAARAKAFNADAVAAGQLADRAVTLAERLGDADLIARALVGFAEAHAADTRDRRLIELLDRAEGLARTASDWRTQTRVFVNRSVSHINLGELENGLADLHHAVETADRSGETQRLAFAYQAVGLESVGAGAWEEGRAAARAGLALDPQRRLNGVVGPAVLAWMEGHYEESLSHLRAFWSDARQRRDSQGVAYGLALLADYTLQLDRPSEAEAPAREAAEVTRSSWPSMLGFVAPLAEILVCVHSPDAEAVLSDAERLIEQTEKLVARPQLLRARGRLLMQRGDLTGAIETLDASSAVARSQHATIELGRSLAVLADAGRKHGDEALVAQADAERAAIVERIGPEVRGLAWAQDAPSAGHAPRGGAGRLSPRELEVVALIARGLTDRQIAEQLVITEGTTGTHVAHILNKLGFHTRTQIATWAVQQGLAAASPTLS